MTGAHSWSWPTIDWRTLRTARWERTRMMMRELGVDHLILTSPDAIRYATDIRTALTPESHEWFAVIVDYEGQSQTYVPFTDEDIPSPYPDLPGVTSMNAAPAWAPATMHPRTWAARLAVQLRAEKALRVGHQGLPHTLVTSLQELLPEVLFQPIDADFYRARRTKFPEEVVLLEAASRVNSRACEAAIDAGRRGTRDYDFIAAAVNHQLLAGVEFLSHGVCNVRKQSGDWYPYGAELREGDAFMFDIGCFGIGGYASDLARVGFVGNPPPPVAKAYKVLLDAHRCGEEAARPGARASDIDAAVNAYLVRNGHPPTPYAMGHGVGLRICESPTIFRPTMMDEDLTLREDDVIALEPETSVEINGVRIVLKIEDNYVVTRDGLRALSDARYEEFG